MDTMFNMPMDEAEARYLRPQQSAQRGIADYLPNVFGALNPQVAGLLGEQQAGTLSKQSNMSGLLGAAIALANGMSSQGPRRSAAQNILTALGSGVQASQGAYQQGLQNFVQQQQFSTSLNRQKAIEDLLKDPQIANDPAAIAYIRANPDDAIKMYSERRMFQSQLDKMRQGRNPAPATAAPVDGNAMPGVPVTASGEVARLESQIQDALDMAAVADQMRDPTKSKLYTERAENLRKQQSRLQVREYDFAGLKSTLPDQFKSQVDLLQGLAQTGDLSGANLQQGVESIFNAVRESAKGMRLEGDAATYAQLQYGTTDMTKLSNLQLADVLKFKNAPTADQAAQLNRESIRTKFDTGTPAPVPTSREQMLGNLATPFNAGQPVAPNITVTPVAPESNAKTAPQIASVAPQTSSIIQPVSSKIQAEPQKQKQAFVPLIEQPDNKVTPKKKQELLAAKPATIELAKYSVKNIAAAKAAAQELKNNPAYIDAITANNPVAGVQTAIATKIPGTDAYTASQLLGNLGVRGFISEIQAMRNASPTGGAVGNVAVAEMNALSNVQAQLSPAMKRAEFIRQIDKYIQNADRALKTIQTEYSRTYGYQGEFDELVRDIQPLQPGLPQGVTVTRKKVP